MDTFLDAFDLPKSNQEDTKHLSRTVTSNENEAVIRKRKAQDLVDSLPGSTRTLKKS
jgi:hypothetical protein